MKIKKHGTFVKWEIDVDCKICGAIITLEKPEDLHAELDKDFGGKCFRSYHFICPECGFNNRISSNQIRGDILEKIKIKSENTREGH